MYLLSPYIQIGIEERCSGSTNQIELGTATIYDYIVPIPPVEEQKKIGLFLKEKCNEIDKLIENKEKIIEELEQYKKSVIYEYVTGKKEVK